MLARNKPGSNPALFLCLGHQGYAEMLREYLVNLIKNAKQTSEIITKYDEKAAQHFKKLISEISNVGENIVVRRRNDEIVASNFTDQYFAVKQNEMPEVGLKRLIIYKPPKDKVPDELIKVYNKISKLHVGLLEDFYLLESLDIVMLHGDEVNEEAILFINWALSLISKFSRSHFKILQEDPQLRKISNLPIGLEIPSSTLYGFDEKDKTLTEIAGLVVYYYDPQTGIVKRDYTLQYHPELMEEIRILQKKDFESKTLLDLPDGIQLLLSCLQAGFIETSKKF